LLLGINISIGFPSSGNKERVEYSNLKPGWILMLSEQQTVCSQGRKEEWKEKGRKLLPG
jgi:hypothetical protein